MGTDATRALDPFLVLPVRIELTTSPLPRGCSTTELRQRRAGCGNRNRWKAAASAAILATRPETAQARSTQRSAGFLAAAQGRSLERMNDRPKAAGKAKQQRRLGAALRENLKRRKAQAKGRSAASGAEEAAKPHDSAGITADKQGS